MRSVNVAELKNRLSKYLRFAKEGEEIVIRARSLPVAKLVPFSSAEANRLQEKTITEIAFFRGFSDAAHFSHAFKKEFGVSPRAFRAQTMTRQGSAHDGRARVFLHSEVSEFPCSSTN